MATLARVHLRQTGEGRRLPEIGDIVEALSEFALQIDDQTLDRRFAADVRLLLLFLVVVQRTGMRRRRRVLCAAAVLRYCAVVGAVAVGGGSDAAEVGTAAAHR